MNNRSTTLLRKAAMISMTPEKRKKQKNGSLSQNGSVLLAGSSPEVTDCSPAKL
jgi:hypothetical protein